MLGSLPSNVYLISWELSFPDNSKLTISLLSPPVSEKKTSFWIEAINSSSEFLYPGVVSKKLTISPEKFEYPMEEFGGKSINSISSIKIPSFDERNKDS